MGRKSRMKKERREQLARDMTLYKLLQRNFDTLVENGADPKLAHEAILRAEDSFSLKSVSEAYAQLLSERPFHPLRRLWDRLMVFLGRVSYSGFDSFGRTA